MKYIIIAIMSIFLACGFPGCNTKESPHAKGVIVDPSLKVRCPFLEAFDPSVELTMGEAFNRLTSLQSQYTECAIRTDCLIEGVEKAEGKTENFLAVCPEKPKD